MHHQTSPRFAALAIFAALFMMSLAACDNDPAPATTTTTMPPVQPRSAQPVDMPEPPFVQEGELAFYAPDGQKILHRLAIEIAASEEERQAGLMWRKSMADDHGMLFIFESPEPREFWTRNTLIPLDIIYISDKLEVVSIQKNCKILNDTPLPSAKPAQYVVEINGGLSDKFGIRPGVRVGWINDILNETTGNFKR